MKNFFNEGNGKFCGLERKNWKLHYELMKKLLFVQSRDQKALLEIAKFKGIFFCGNLARESAFLEKFSTKKYEKIIFRSIFYSLRLPNKDQFS
jgi:hypothetical protein